MGVGGLESQIVPTPIPHFPSPCCGIFYGILNVSDAPLRALSGFNPGAGQNGSSEQDIHAARDVWREHGWQVELRPTAGPGDGIRIAREAAAQGYDLVVAAGGD